MERQLTGLDSAFLAVETHAAHMHMTSVVALEPTDGSAASFDEIRAHLGPRLREMPVFRRRLEEVPLGLDHPVWAERDFDLDAHLHRAALPSPGSPAELEALVGHLTALPLDRSRPLWDMWVVEGLGQDRTALITKVHHALLDGVAGMEVFGQLFDADPDAPALAAAPARGPDVRPPSRAALLRGALRSLARRPFEIARRSIEVASTVARRAWTGPARAGPDPLLPATLSAPDAPMSGAITARREVALGSIPLEELHALKRVFEVKLNDVILELCTGSLRRYLGDRQQLPREALVAAIPVSTAGDASQRTTGNQVSAISVELPVHLADPVARLSHIHRETMRAKRAHRALGGDLLAGWAEMAPPVLLSGLAEVYSRLDLADRHRPVINLIVSNVPGPQFGLFCAGHRVQACYPLGPIYEGCALNLTVMSYDGQLHFGWASCPDTVPDLSRLKRSLSEALSELRAVAEQCGGRRR